MFGICPRCGEEMTDQSQLKLSTDGFYHRLCSDRGLLSRQFTLCNDALFRRLTEELEKAIKEQIPLTFDQLAEVGDEHSKKQDECIALATRIISQGD